MFQTLTNARRSGLFSRRLIQLMVKLECRRSEGLRRTALRQLLDRGDDRLLQDVGLDRASAERLIAGDISCRR